MNWSEHFKNRKNNQRLIKLTNHQLDAANYKAVVIDPNAKIDKQKALQSVQILIDAAEEAGKEASLEQKSTGEEV